MRELSSVKKLRCLSSRLFTFKYSERDSQLHNSCLYRVESAHENRNLPTDRHLPLLVQRRVYVIVVSRISYRAQFIQITCPLLPPLREIAIAVYDYLSQELFIQHPFFPFLFPGHFALLSDYARSMRERSIPGLKKKCTVRFLAVCW